MGLLVRHCRFKTETFKSLLSRIKSTVITNTKGEFNLSVEHQGIRYDYGTGGLHASREPGVYKADEVFTILDCDVSSLYPSIAVQYGLYPEHLGPEFCDVYKKEIVDKRLAEKAKKEQGDKAIVEGFKEAANIVFGKSNSKYSFLYDPYYAMGTTINGQLFLSLLIDWLSEIPTLSVIQANTDGITVIVGRDDVARYQVICNEWQEATKLSLEFKEYRKFILVDVNNYCAMDTSGKIKSKGKFEIDKEYHKNASFRIVPMALNQHFFHSTDISEFIKEHKDIFDFCGFFKATEGWRAVLEDPISKETKECQKRSRYYVSTSGAFFYKCHQDGRKEFIERGWLITLFNQFEQKEDYNINYNFYIEATKDIIASIENKQTMKQLTLF